jgi:hypothetical protein
MTNHSFVIRKINDEYDSRGHTKVSSPRSRRLSIPHIDTFQSQWMIQLPHGVDEYTYPPDADRSIIDGRTLVEVCNSDIIQWVPQAEEVPPAEEPDFA